MSTTDRTELVGRLWALLDAGISPSDAIDRTADDFASLTPDDRRRVIRMGLRTMLTDMAEPLMARSRIAARPDVDTRR